MATPLARRTEPGGAFPRSSRPRPARPICGASQPARHRRPGRRRARAADRALGRPVPWFITLQYGGSNATAVDLISGLAAAGLGFAALRRTAR